MTNLRSNEETINERDVFSKVTIVYMSPNGSTRKCAELITEQLKGEGEVLLIDLARINSSELKSIISETTLLGVGSPTYHLNMLDPVKTFLEGIPNVPVKKGPGRYSFCFTTYGHVNSGKTLVNIAKILHKKHYTVLGALKLRAKHFYQNSIEFPITEDQDLILKFCKTVKYRITNPIEWRKYQRC